MYNYAAKIIRWVDGDTFEATVDVGFRMAFTDKFRVLGINAPEMNTPEGPAAKAYAEKLTPPGSLAMLRTTKPDKYGRWLADIILDLSGKTLSEEMVRAGQAAPYMV